MNDIRELLRTADGGEVGGPDHAEIRRRGRRLVVVRRTGIVSAVVAAVAVVGGLSLQLPETQPRPPVTEDPTEDPRPGTAEGWPVLVRYVETRLDVDGDTPLDSDGRAYEWELGARNWDAWTMVRVRSMHLDERGEPRDPSPDGHALEQQGDERWIGTAHVLDEDERTSPFGQVEALLAGEWADRAPLEEHPDGEDAWIPLGAFAETPASPDEVADGELAASDLPGLRAGIAEQLDLDADDLVAFTVEAGDDTYVTWVREDASGLPLHYEVTTEAPADSDDGQLTEPGEVLHRIEATDVELEAQLPEAPAEDGPDAAEGADAEGQWRQLAAAPVAGRQRAGAVWTGDELLVWGGVPRAGGAAYDPDTDAWRPLPDAPLDAREGHVAVWSGSELLIWGGHAYDEPDDPDTPVQPDGRNYRADGAAYDPATDTWRPLAQSPLDPRTGAAAVWTGSELVIVSGTGQGIDPGTTRSSTDGAAYDPEADSWRELPELPDDGLREVGRDAVWTGEQMLVGGSRFAPNLAAGYDPDGDAWELIDGSPLAGAGGIVAWTGTEALVTDTMSDRLAAYDPAADNWGELPPPPGEPPTAITYLAEDGRTFAIGDHGQSASSWAWVLADDGERWHPLGEPPIEQRGRPAAVWTGTELVLFSGAAVAVADEIAAHDDGAAWRPEEVR